MIVEKDCALHIEEYVSKAVRHIVCATYTQHTAPITMVKAIYCHADADDDVEDIEIATI